MWRCKLIFLFAIMFGIAMSGQKIPDAPGYQVPDDDEYRRILKKRNSFVDELLDPLSYYMPKDEIFYHTPDTVRASRKIRRAYFVFDGPSEETPESMYYGYYDKSGRLEQMAIRYTYDGDSLVHKWKYDAAGNLKSYVTVTFTFDTGKRKAHGDSIAIKCNALGNPLEITRYSITGAGASRTASFVSKDTYTYNADNSIAMKLIDGYKYKYVYNTAKQVTRIECKANYDGEIYTIDSFAWRSGEVADTMEHWALSAESRVKLKMEKQTFNKQSGLELEYVLYVLDKFNYIRDLEGPVCETREYDAALRLIRYGIYELDGELLHESTYTYSLSGMLQSFVSMSQHNPEEDGRPLPPAATAFKGKLYVATDFTYLTTVAGQMPSEVTMQGLLIGIGATTREIIARSAATGKIRIVCDYYQ